ncbi:TPA: translation initiation factor 2 (IF-2, GTPase) [Pseudomonas aeruginosa]|nr:translation initiation factor 2 (IF-2, GTPase) [Pseudomonas aeruginosa]
MMRPSTAHCLLLSLSLGASLALAEEPAPAPLPAAQPSIAQASAELERRLVETERQRDELVSRMRQENRQLREQLQAALAQRQPPLLTEEQTWYVAGAATALLAFVLGALSRGRRRQRREWIN